MSARDFHGVNDVLDDIRDVPDVGGASPIDLNGLEPGERRQGCGACYDDGHDRMGGMGPHLFGDRSKLSCLEAGRGSRPTHHYVGTRPLDCLSEINCPFRARSALLIGKSLNSRSP